VNAKLRAKQYAVKHGLIAKKPATFKKTEFGQVYEYSTSIANLFCGWSAQRRDNNQDYSFREFYEQLPEEKKAAVAVTIL
jgi:hypothetical protein